MWTQSDLSWLAANYSSLREISPGVIEGRISFRMLRSDGVFTVNPSAGLVQNTQSPDYLFIKDKYDVKVTWPDSEQYPIAEETGGKLAATAKRLNKKLEDMHQNLQGTLCLAADMAFDSAFRDGFKLDVFIEELLIPYLFAQSHFAETKEWLWGELSHGKEGILEWLSRLEEPTKEDIASTRKSLSKYIGTESLAKLMAVRWRPHFKCLCESGLKTRDCHPEIIKALSLLRSTNQ